MTTVSRQARGYAMWDEQERFAGVIAKTFKGLLMTLGVVLAVASLVTGNFVFLTVFLMFLLCLAAITLVYGLIAVSLGGALLGIVCVVNRCFRPFQGAGAHSKNCVDPRIEDLQL